MTFTVFNKVLTEQQWTLRHTLSVAKAGFVSQAGQRILVKVVKVCCLMNKNILPSESD